MADATWHRGSRAEEGGEGVTGDLAMVVSAAAVAAVAFTGWHLPTTLTIAGVLALLLAARTIGRSRPGPILLLVLLLITGQHADMSISALDAPLPATVEGTGRLVSDPVVRVFDTQVIVEVDGRRYQASVPLEVAAPLRPLLTGEMVVISGRTQKLEGAPRGWVLSWHLAGRLKVSSIEAGEPSRPWYRLANGLRRIIQRGSSSMEDDQAALYLGLVVGDDRGQSEVLKFRFGASGLTHLLAVSGQNVAFLLSVAAPLLNRMGTRSKLFAAGAMLAVFTLVTRGEPSVMRAVVMASVAMGAVALGRLASGARILALTVITLILIDPLLVHSVGFQLSVSATAGLLVLARPIEERLPGPEILRLPLAVTIAAQLATAPILMGLSSGVPVAATPANLLAVPPAGFVMMMGVTGGVLAGLLRSQIAVVLMWPASWLVRWINWVAEIGSQLPLGVLGPMELVVAGAALGLVLLRPAGRWRVPVTGLGLICLVLVCWPVSPPGGATELVEGAELFVGACGGTVLALSSGARADRVMEALWRIDIRQLDIAIIDGGRSVSRVAQPLRDQFGIRRVLTTSHEPALGMESLVARPVRVGDLLVRLVPEGEPHGGKPADVLRVEALGGECKF